MGLVHGGRAQDQHLGAINLDRQPGRGFEQWKHRVFLARQQALVVGRHLNRPHRGALVVQAQLIQRLLVQRLPAAGHRQDGKPVAQHQRGQHGHLAGAEHRDVQHAAQSRHARVAHGIDANRGVALVLRAATGLKDGGVSQHKIMVAGVVDRSGLDAAVVKLQFRAELQAGQLLLAQQQVVSRHGKRDDDQYFFHLFGRSVEWRSGRGQLIKRLHLTQFIAQFGLSVPKVKPGLHIQPELGAISQQRAQAQRHFG